ncbi:MAG: hypothetical protein KBT34_10740 [Prevotella sp.]|nr:hypothetical protein [Candidatus Prevotella equi]
MKASELQMGDLVRYSSSKRVVVVDSVLEDGINYVYCQGELDLIDEERIEPIPLTKEILEKNGWELSLSCEFYTHKSDRNLKLSNLLGVPSISCFGKTSILHYAHEFQHALRLCGLKELAGNFKVE